MLVLMFVEENEDGEDDEEDSDNKVENKGTKSDRKKKQ